MYIADSPQLALGFESGVGLRRVSKISARSEPLTSDIAIGKTRKKHDYILWAPTSFRVS